MDLFDLIIPFTFTIPEMMTHALAISIFHKRHDIDRKGYDKSIDFEKQYVRLKLISHEEIKRMQLDSLERPDYYQTNVEEIGGKDIRDEEILQSEMNEYVLIRGRAGIGKSTLVQRLLWKWANDEWATKFKAMFLLNVRYLMTIDRAVDLCDLLSLYAVYPCQSVTSEWLKDNEKHIGVILGMTENDYFNCVNMQTVNSTGRKQTRPFMSNITIAKFNFC